jgi:GNAT superfamily N-acetyltransferase
MDILFSTVDLHARELREDEIPALQAFYEANPAYSMRVNGVPPPADSALEEFHERPPAHLPYTQRWLLGVFDREGALAAVIDCVRDLCASGVWHLGLFLVATARHGRGDAQALYDAWEAWVRSHGPDAAQWLRLGVVVGNTPAERFWARQGYLQTRLREGVYTGGRVNILRVMAKPLDPGLAAKPGADALPVYLAKVPRDAPDSPLP